MAKSVRFGELLREGLLTVVACQHTTMTAVRERFAEVLGVNSKTLERWQSGALPGEGERDLYIEQLAQLIIENSQGRLDRVWLKSFLQQGRYVEPERLCQTLLPLEDVYATLYVRIVGTPYAYHAPLDKACITFGRQRARDGASVEGGNDIVIRVPGSSKKSLRISRQHMEIQRLGADYYVVDKGSRNGTKHNGEQLMPHKQTLLTSGDMLLVADVLSLEVVIQPQMSVPQIAHNNIQVILGDEDEDSLFLEATIGDWVTEADDV